MDSSEQQHRSQQESEGTEQATPSPTAGEPTAEQEEQVGEDYRYPPEVTDVPLHTVLI
ncbi:hypothetical protein [Rothia kristinae]|uniref:hypothetical protein n=1 Tax=Rothia kristinae TaxID=37923 RepID=UPI001643BCCB|nr:hypothetical protein [Rothia kristinae]